MEEERNQNKIVPPRPKRSPVTQVNDGLGDTPFKRALLHWLVIGCIILFVIAFALLMYVKIKENIK